jgi:hypothetical protein
MLQLFLKKNKNCIINFYFIIYNNKYTYIKLKTEIGIKKNLFQLLKINFKH